MNIIKVYGKGSVNDLAEDTLHQVELHKKVDDVVVFIDMDGTDGYVDALANNIYYIPTLVAETADGEEIGFCEHTKESISLWHQDIQAFMEELRELE